VEEAVGFEQILVGFHASVVGDRGPRVVDRLLFIVVDGHPGPIGDFDVIPLAAEFRQGAVDQWADVVAGVLDRPQGVAVEAVGHLQCQAGHVVAHGADGDGYVLPHRRRGGDHLLVIRLVVHPIVGLKALVGTGDDVTHRAHGIPQVGHQLVVGQAVHADGGGGQGAAEAEHEAAFADAVHVHGHVGGFKRAAGGGNGHAGG